MLGRVIVWRARVTTLFLASALASGLRERFAICATCVPTDEDVLGLWKIADGDEAMMQILVDDAHEIGTYAW